MTPAPTLEHAARLDAQDPLAHCRERFTLPPGVIYLDGQLLAREAQQLSEALGWKPVGTVPALPVA